MTNSSSQPKRTTARHSFPLEGILYDQLSLANFVDVENHWLCFYLRRSWNTDFFTKFFDCHLPSKVSIGYKLLNLSNFSRLEYQPKGKISLSTQLVDLSGGEKRTKGALMWKATANTEGESSYGFQIDRLIALGQFHDTRLYGNVDIRKTHSCQQWQTKSSFGVDQRVRLFGTALGFRMGATPEGQLVSELKL
ncbi:hypothetical protein GpartN1_g5219.t1 [Galdieria partita]|uniref:Uncharacterized protein n=1 Tax=Galdieria partita TaxID=83374 RepID=A0A9C7PZ34_9RHOD|nr:hypothetical protein GpartN1_g5219.t1 [Galdieria partita]